MCVMASSTQPLSASVIPLEEVCSPMVFLLLCLVGPSPISFSHGSTSLRASDRERGMEIRWFHRGFGAKPSSPLPTDTWHPSHPIDSFDFIQNLRPRRAFRQLIVRVRRSKNVRFVAVQRAKNRSGKPKPRRSGPTFIYFYSELYSAPAGSCSLFGNHATAVFYYRLHRTERFIGIIKNQSTRGGPRLSDSWPAMATSVLPRADVRAWVTTDK